METTDRASIEQNKLFQGTNFTNVEYMLEQCTARCLDTGEELLLPDVPNHHLYLICDGKLSIRLGSPESQELATLGSGECVGEISLVDGKNPTAMVVAATPTRVLSVPHDTVWSLVEHSHEIARNLLGIVAGRVRNDKQALITSNNTRKQFERQAYVDALTGVHNRRWMSNAFPRTMRRCIFNKRPFTIMMVDIDHFKRINDLHGHLTGDLALQTITNCLTENLRPNDLFVRYGGEEFVVLLPETDERGSLIVAERLREATADTTIQHDDLTFQITISIGMTSTRHEMNLAGLIEEADKALYRAKELGRNRVETFELSAQVTKLYN